MFNLFKRNKEPLHTTRKTVFDNESIPAAALDGNLERRVAALEKLGRDIEPRFNDLVDIHKKEITVHHANEVARKARMDAESATHITTGTINTKELNTSNVGNRGVHPERGHAAPSVPPKSQPKVRIEFDDIANPTVWIDGKKVTALESMDMHWMTRIKKKGEYRFGISYFDSKDPASLPVKWDQSNMQPTHSGEVGNIQCKLSIDGTQLAKAFKDFEESPKAKSVTGNRGYSADEFGVYARQVGDAFSKSQMGTGTETKGWWHWGSDRPEAVVPLDTETLDRIGRSVSVRTVYTSKESPKIRSIGDLWFVMSEDADGRDVAKSLKEWDGWMWVPVMGD